MTIKELDEFNEWLLENTDNLFCFDNMDKHNTIKFYIDNNYDIPVKLVVKPDAWVGYFFDDSMIIESKEDLKEFLKMIYRKNVDSRLYDYVFENNLVHLLYQY